jgi:hypothetical protein
MEKNLLTCLQEIIVVFIFLWINHGYSEADTLERGRFTRTSTFKIEKVSYIPQTDAAVILHHEKSLLSCVYHCQSLELESSYFNQNNSTCYCRTVDDNNTDNYENVDADITHGIRTEMMSITYIQVRYFLNRCFIILLNKQPRAEERPLRVRERGLDPCPCHTSSSLA